MANENGECDNKKRGFSDKNGPNTKNVLVAVTGSVASVKLPKIVEALTAAEPKVNVQVVATEHSTHFFDQENLAVKLYRDNDEWDTWSKMQDPVLHIELRRWADLMVICPLDANTMAKMANGICDNLLTCIVRAWDSSRPLLFCPAMNTYMWDHPLTSEHVDKLCKMGYTYVPPIKKTLACGDTGVGAMAEWSTVVATVLEHVKKME